MVSNLIFFFLIWVMNCQKLRIPQDNLKWLFFTCVRHMMKLHLCSLHIQFLLSPMSKDQHNEARVFFKFYLNWDAKPVFLLERYQPTASHSLQQVMERLVDVYKKEGLYCFLIQLKLEKDSKLLQFQKGT